MFHLQTVWEAEQTNSPQRGPRKAKQFGIEMPVGYDAHVDGERSSTVMHRFGTGGTPWTVVVDKAGIIRLNEVTPRDFDRVEELVEKLRREPAPAKRR